MLTQLREAADELEARSLQVLGIGPQAPYQAQHLIDEGMPFPLLLDPDDALRKLVGADRPFSRRQAFDPRGIAAYWRAARQVRHSDPIWTQHSARPAVLIVDADFTVVWSRVASRLGDYAMPAEILAAADAHLDRPRQ